jgi:hypothetical protein
MEGIFNAKMQRFNHIIFKLVLRINHAKSGVGLPRFLLLA